MNWKNIVIFILLLCIAGFLVWWFGFNRISENLNEEKSDWKIYRSEEYGFEIKHPRDWLSSEEIIAKPGEGSSDSIWQELEGLGITPKVYITIKSFEKEKAIIIDIFDNLNGHSAEEWVELYSRINPVGANLSFEEYLTIENIQFLSGAFGCCMDYPHSLFLADDDKMYFIKGGQRDFETGEYDYDELFIEMVSTFKILD